MPDKTKAAKASDDEAFTEELINKMVDTIHNAPPKREEGSSAKHIGKTNAVLMALGALGAAIGGALTYADNAVAQVKRRIPHGAVVNGVYTTLYYTRTAYQALLQTGPIGIIVLVIGLGMAAGGAIAAILEHRKWSREEKED